MATKRFLAISWLVLAAIGPAYAADPAPVAPGKLQALLIELIQSKDDARPAIYERIAATRSPELVPALNAYDAGLLRLDEGRPVLFQPRIDLAGRGRVYPIVDAITQKPLIGPKGEPRYAEKLGPLRKAPPADRKAIAALVGRLSLFERDPYRLKKAIVTAGDRATESARDVLAQGLEQRRWGTLTYEAQVAVARIDLVHGDRREQLAAARRMAELAPLGSLDLIETAQADARKRGDTELVAAIAGALDAIARYQWRVNMVQETFAGLSLGSILILLALGLSIIFGLMRVINMAHGEFMMIGAFTTFVICQLFKRHVPAAFFDYYWLLAMPAAFLVAGFVGWVCEVTIIRRLYGRPLESLLATWGISLILIQGVRVAFGDTTAINPPSWFVGGYEAFRGLVLPWNRIFIIGYCTACIALVYLVVFRTKFGMLLRATQQNRDMASALGVDTRRIDGLAFAFGTGLAGLAGCAVVLFDKLNPQMGQGYIVDSFMVVIAGGIGKLQGVVVSGIGLGFLTKYIEPWLQAVYGKVAVLLLLILFIQRWPAGLFADKGRLGDD